MNAKKKIMMTTTVCIELLTTNMVKVHNKNGNLTFTKSFEKCRLSWQRLMRRSPFHFWNAPNFMAVIFILQSVRGSSYRIICFPLRWITSTLSQISHKTQLQHKKRLNCLLDAERIESVGPFSRFYPYFISTIPTIKYLTKPHITGKSDHFV